MDPIEAPSFPADAVALAQPRLLLVDDLEDARVVISRGFSRRGFAVSEAASAEEAFDLLAQGAFDAVLLDIIMPGVDGFDALARIRATYDADQLPVIMVTLCDGTAEVSRALRLGANDYVTKPLNFELAVARVRSQVQRKQALEAARRADPDRASLVEELREAMQRTEAAARAKSEFLANMSHEIRTPLNGILGMARMLADRSAGPDLQRAAGVIADSAIALERLLSDALDLSRVEAGKVEIRAEPFDLGALVERVCDLFRPAADEKRVALDVRIEPAARGVVLGDPLRVQQILTNLLSNAVKFTEEGEVACRVWRDPDLELVRVEVRDSGIGFDPARAEALFGRFEQADGTIAPRFGGSGLGLAISRGLAELMRGSLTASSRPGEGAVFRLDLPLRAVGGAAAETPAAPSFPPAYGRKPRILAADDHATNRQVIEIVLGPLEPELLLVSDGAAALEAWSAGGFDLVLMDVQMPVLDGLSAIRALRARETERGLARTPVIALSAHASPEHEQISRSAGADRHLTKPIRAEALIATIVDLLSGAAATEPAAREAFGA